jgi:hypothetical protein
MIDQITDGWKQQLKSATEPMVMPRSFTGQASAAMPDINPLAPWNFWLQAAQMWQHLDARCAFSQGHAFTLATSRRTKASRACADLLANRCLHVTCNGEIGKPTVSLGPAGSSPSVGLHHLCDPIDFASIGLQTPSASPSLQLCTTVAGGRDATIIFLCDAPIDER